MVAVIGIDTELAVDLEGVFAPVVDIDQRVIERRTVVAREGVAITKRVGSREDVRGYDFVEQTLELGVRQVDAVERLELLPEVSLKRCTVTNVRAMLVL